MHDGRVVTSIIHLDKLPAAPPSEENNKTSFLLYAKTSDTDPVYGKCVVTIEYKNKVGVTLSEFAYTNKLPRPGGVNFVTSLRVENNT